MATVHFHVAHPCPEASFTLGHFFGELAGHTAVEVPDRATFINMEGPRVAYGGEKIQGALTIRPWALAGLLEPLPADPPMSTWQSMPVLFPVAEGDLPFDPVAGTYFHLTRMEEDHLPVEEHGRPRTSAMHAARHGYLHRPVVDEWLHAVLAYWRTVDPLAPQPQRTYSQTATMDVDNGAMYLGRAWWRTVGGTGRDLLKGRLGRVRDRAATLLGLRADPYAVHGSFIRLAQENGARTMLNFMAADRGEHDHAVEIRRGHMRRMLLGLETGGGSGPASRLPQFGKAGHDGPGESPVGRGPWRHGVFGASALPAVSYTCYPTGGHGLRHGGRTQHGPGGQHRFPRRYLQSMAVL
jgi:hypothetical protein